MNISAVIVNYFTKDLLSELLVQLEENELVQEIIVVDNSAQLGKELSRQDSSKIKLISNRINLGFGAAINQAAHNAACSWLLAVNPDIRFLPGCIENLAAAAQEYGSPLVGPRFYWDDDKLFKLPPATGQSRWWHLAQQAAAMNRLDAELLSFYWRIRHDRFWQARAPFEEPFLSGACLLIDLDWLSGVKQPVFDEDFFLYFEDTDLCVRILEGNETPICVPEAEAIHYWNQAPGGEKAALMGQSESRFWNKHYGFAPRDMDICSSSSVSNYLNLGTIQQNHRFKTSGINVSVSHFFEFGLSPLFVPFAQCQLQKPEFIFPVPIWNRLAPGEYYSRIRSETQGTEEYWKWKKA